MTGDDGLPPPPPTVPPPAAPVDVDAFIRSALARGLSGGLAGLNPVERAVLLIARAEDDCDGEGIDAFLDRYRKPVVLEAAGAFAAVGANAVAAALAKVGRQLPNRNDRLLGDADELIKARDGYEPESIREYVAAQLGVAASHTDDDDADSEPV